MNAREPLHLADIQADRDLRNVSIDAVGIKGIRHPVTVRYGAHNQRSHIGIEVQLAGAMELREIIGVAERSASCQVYGLLKRADEKFVTEQAYDNPRFVEDLVRDVALALQADARVDRFVVDAEYFESIHNHSAIARVAWVRRREAPVALAA